MTIRNNDNSKHHIPVVISKKTNDTSEDVERIILFETSNDLITLDDIQNLDLSPEIQELMYRFHRQRDNEEQQDSKYLSSFDEIQIKAIHKDSLHEDLEYKELIMDLRSAIKQLPFKQKRRLLLHYAFGHSIKEIARAENISEKTIYRSIDKAICSIKKQFVGQDCD